MTTASGTVLDVPRDADDGRGGPRSGTVVVLRDVAELERLRAEARRPTRDGLTAYSTGGRSGNWLADAVIRRADGPSAQHGARRRRPAGAVSDSHGRAVGDAVLVAVGHGWPWPPDFPRRRPPGSAAEFVLVLPGAGREAALQADDVRTWCAGLDVPTDAGRPGDPR